MRRRDLLGICGIATLAGCIDRSDDTETEDDTTTDDTDDTDDTGDTDQVTDDADTDQPENGDDPQPVEEHEYADEYSTVIDLIEEGADPDGETPIDSVLEDVAADDTLIVVPDGEYAIGSVVLEGYSNIGLVAHTDAEPELYPTTASQNVFRFRAGENARLEGLTFVQTDEAVGGTVGMNVAGDFVMRDIHKIGTHPRTADDRGTAGFNASVTSADGVGIVEDCSAPDGDNRDGRGAVGMFIPRGHSGELYIRNIHLEGFTDNGLYGSAPSLENGGPVHVEGGLFVDNNISGVRVASEGSTISDATIMNTSSAPYDYSTVQRAIWMPFPKDDITIENVDICQYVDEQATAGDLGAGIVIGQPEAGGHVENVRIRNDGNAPAIHLGGENPGWTGDDIHLTGDGDMTYPEEFENVCIGEDCDGPAECP